MTQATKSSRFLIEAFVIVVSILLAFSIDAWWDERSERSEETEILAGLHREFDGYRDVLKSPLRFLDSYRCGVSSRARGG